MQYYSEDFKKDMVIKMAAAGDGELDAAVHPREDPLEGSARGGSQPLCGPDGDLAQVLLHPLHGRISKETAA